MIPARLKTFKYHKELIELLLTPKIGVVIIGVIAPLLFFLLFQDIPMDILYTLTLSHFTLFIARIYLGNYFLQNLYILDDDVVELNLKKYLLIILSSNLLWCSSIILTFIYSDILHVFILLTALLTIISGAMVIIASIYHAVTIYVMTILPTSILSLLYFGDKDIHYATAFFLLIFLYVVVSSSFKNYQLLENSISQKEKIELLNKSLQKKVDDAIEETREKEKQLQEQARMAQMGEMISMIAHQWRQPLSAIGAIVIGLQLRTSIKAPKEYEKESSSSQEDVEEDYKTISELVQFLSTTIDDFRDFFKTDKAKSLINLTTPVDKALQIIESSLTNKGIKVIKEFQNDDKLLLYPNEMIQVILNILKNSEDNFVEKKTPGMRIKISTYKDDDEYVVSISDNGGGIPEDILQNIFDPYFSTKGEKNGTGIGLYMSKTMIEKHNGGKMIATNIENGAEFKIVLKPENTKEHSVQNQPDKKS